MIRRDITSPTGEQLWLLISQVEHARLSGELVRNWREEYADDVIDAITHHDDGWAAWEAEPKLNPELGGPYSFLEMPVPAALVIWDHSIAAAEKFGPLPAYIVAGHFYSLLSSSEHANDPLAVAWLTAKRKHRTGWLDAWARGGTSRSLDYPKRAQQMLLLSDLFSLWLCCDCPADAERGSILGNSAMKLQTETLLNQFKFTVNRFEFEIESSGSRLGALRWDVTVSPYPFQAAPLTLTAAGTVVPRKRYESWNDLQTASWTVALHWQLLPSAPDNGSPVPSGSV